MLGSFLVERSLALLTVDSWVYLELQIHQLHQSDPVPLVEQNRQGCLIQMSKETHMREELELE